MAQETEIVLEEVVNRGQVPKAHDFHQKQQACQKPEVAGQHKPGDLARQQPPKPRNKEKQHARRRANEIGQPNVFEQLVQRQAEKGSVVAIGEARVRPQGSISAHDKEGSGVVFLLLVVPNGWECGGTTVLVRVRTARKEGLIFSF